MKKVFLFLSMWKRERDQAKHWKAVELVATTYGISPKILALILLKHSLGDEGVTRFLENQEASFPKHFNIRKSG
ncbi:MULTISPECIES: hypothetical protein [Paenibacillus]|uniref:hypothetical protein n=1 Tax=Paenibacillus TaxID=44249 RepID=UPI00096FAFB5|nr:hypothetical protein [Paenibacillus odorifer]OMD80422.1 hypothetical protein BSK53_20400 [Paenibacillus odorifer]